MTSSFPRKPLPPETVAKIEALEKLLAEAGLPRLEPHQKALLGSSLLGIPVARSPHVPPGRIVLTRSPLPSPLDPSMARLFLLPEVPTVSMTAHRPRLRDRIWSHFQAFRRFLWRLRGR